MGNRWAQYWANRYSWATKNRSDIDNEDLLQAALMGEYLAKRNYTPDKGSFSTFSAFCIRNEIRDLIGIKNGTLPPVMTSLDRYIQGPDGQTETTLLDTLEDKTLPDKDETLFDEQRQKGIRDAVRRLPDRQRRVMEMFYLDGKGVKAIGETLGLTASQVVHITEQGRRAMRKDRLLRQLADIDAPYYAYIGVKHFQTTHTSAVEHAYFILERERAKLTQQLVEIEQDTQEDYCKQEAHMI